jgi:tetratricopeptide (TPR) repeat protein
MKVYTAKSAAKLLDLSIAQVRGFARAGVLQPERGTRGEYRFSFQDLVVLRTAKGLLAAQVPPRRLHHALLSLRQQLPSGSPLTGVRVVAEGERVVVRDGRSVWNPVTGQSQFNFDVRGLAREAEPLARVEAERALEAPTSTHSAEDWHALGCDLETTSPEQALEAYRRALDLKPDQVESRINLGRLLHEQGHFPAAEAHYRLALSSRPQDPTALFDLAVCLEDLGRTHEAIATYREAIDADPRHADAYYNVARLYEGCGDAPAALRYLQAYRKLIEDPAR